jgi:hypothetical protein
MTTPPYAALVEKVRSLGGEMAFAPGTADDAGSGGGRWIVELHGRTLTVIVRNNRVNDLDRLYEAKGPNPQTWADYAENPPLTADVFWKLVQLAGWRVA